MKGIISLFAFILISSGLFAQKRSQSTLRIQLSDGSPLTVSINGRYFQKVGKSLTIGDLPRKRHSIKVYKYRSYQDGQGGKAELVYSGKIKVDPGGTYDCYVDLDTRQFRMREVSSLTAVPDDMPGKTRGVDVDLPPSATRSATLEQLKKQMDAKDNDAGKLKIAKDWVAQKKAATAEIKDIASWFFFDDTRLDFVKYSHHHVTDPDRYHEVGSVFTLDTSYQEFERYMQQNR